MKKQITALLTATVLTFGAVPAAETILPESVQTYVTASAADSAPAKVTGVKASGITQTAATLKWSKAAKAKGYRIYVYNTKTKKYTKVTTISKSGTVSYKLTGLKADTSYKYKVRAYNKVNGKTVWGTSSAAVTVKTKSYAPAQVTGLKSSSVTKTSAVLSWSKADNAKGYRIYKLNDSTKKYEKVTTVNSSTTKYTVSGLVSGKTYKFKVRAYRKVSGVTYWGDSSAAVSVTTKKNDTPAYDDTKAAALKDAGEYMFNDLTTYYKAGSEHYMYSSTNAIVTKPWETESAKTLKQSDKEYFIAGLMVGHRDLKGRQGLYGDSTLYLPIACKAYYDDKDNLIIDVMSVNFQNIFIYPDSIDESLFTVTIDHYVVYKGTEEYVRAAEYDFNEKITTMHICMP